jgi:protein-disulfide isomerase
MTGRIVWMIGLALIAGATGGYLSAHHLAGVTPGGSSDGKGGDISETRVTELVKTYIQDNPKDIIDSLQQWQMREESNRLKQQQSAVGDYVKYFKENHHYGVAGNPKGDITVVEFFDYNCPACKMMFESLDSVMKEDKNLRVVFVEYPIFGPMSDMNARIATSIAKIAPDKYYAFHTAMMRQKGKVNAEQAYEIAKNTGVDIEKLKEEVAKPENLQHLQKDREVATALHIQGTPALIIGDRMINSALSVNDLKTQIQTSRDAGKNKQPENKEKKD